MKFVCNFYVYVLIIVFTRGIWLVRCAADFKVGELQYLSKKLEPTECLKLLDAVYQRTSFKQEMGRAEKIHKALRRDFGKSWVTRENCLFQLGNWNKNFPGRESIKGREVMEEALRYLGRRDLARQIRQNRRKHFLNHIVNSQDFFENNKHEMSRRYAFQHDKDSVFNKNKYSKINDLGNNVEHHKITLQGDDDGNLHPTQLIITGEILKENQSEISDNNQRKNEKSEINYNVYWIILITVIALIIMSICATGVFVIYRKNCNRFINGQICQEWALDQDGKQFCVCCCGKRKENRKFYSDVDMESGWSGRCSKYWFDSGDNNGKSRSKQETNSEQRLKKLKKKRKQSKTKEKTHKNEEKKPLKNKTLEKEPKSQKSKKTAGNEPSNKNDCLLKNECKCCKCSYTSEDQGKCKFFKKKACNDLLCNKYKLKNITDQSLSSETEFITTSRKGKKKDKSRYSSCDTSPRFKDKKKTKEPKNKDKLFQYDSCSPCSRKTCDWRKIAKEKKCGKNSV